MAGNEEVSASGRVVKKVIEIENAGPVVEMVIDNENDSHLTLIKLGDKNKGWIPSAAMFKQFRTMLERAIESPDAKSKIVFTHAFVDIVKLELPKGKVMVIGAGDVTVVDKDDSGTVTKK